uniref:tRNA (guanine(26)-N(2))-dimethyltransferase n=4 Tax=Palpitomonas bilix TaxID=652834 RepID=A0A7S3G7D6_9EUKA|mmetsp:Transcript_25639/g.64423  ORF Transcript_25639/g.64423 Transcript_25639/m.64423 type:complete len:242 (+) Transcript_25639:287-1012(+)
MDFYIRVFVRVRTSAAGVKDSPLLASRVYQCTGCGTFELEPVAKFGNSKYTPATGPKVGQSCPQCGGKWHIGGPIYNGDIHTPSFVDRVLAELDKEEEFQSHKRLRGLLTAVKEEVHVPLFYSPGSMANTLRCSTPPLAMLKSAIINAGYIVSQCHTEPLSLKTNAPSSFLWDAMKAWAKQKGEGGGAKKGSPGASILAREITHEIDFSAAEEAERKAESVRFVPAPEAGWGPKPRAGTKR